MTMYQALTSFFNSNSGALFAHHLTSPFALFFGVLFKVKIFRIFSSRLFSGVEAEEGGSFHSSFTVCHRLPPRIVNVICSFDMGFISTCPPRRSQISETIPFLILSHKQLPCNKIGIVRRFSNRRKRIFSPTVCRRKSESFLLAKGRTYGTGGPYAVVFYNRGPGAVISVCESRAGRAHLRRKTEGGCGLFVVKNKKKRRFGSGVFDFFLHLRPIHRGAFRLFTS